MRFSIEQIFLTAGDGKPLAERVANAYHVVEADTLDAALTSFLRAQDAEIIGQVQRFHGAQATATAHQASTVFTVHLMPGSDAFLRKPERGSAGAAGGGGEPSRETRQQN